MTSAGDLESFRIFCASQNVQMALVLGSGLGPVVDRWGRIAALPFTALEGLPASTVPGHRGQFSLVEVAGQKVIVQEGRLHFYEGHPWERVILPTQVLATLGVRVILHTNAAGGIADRLAPGSLMAITDHIDLTRPHWWHHPGPRPSPYSGRLIELLDRTAERCGIVLHHGIYASLTGPSYETPAEIRALRSWGADAVGMSTAREVEAGVAAGIACAAISCITNRAAGLSDRPLSHQEVIETGAALSRTLARLLEGFVEMIGKEE